MERGLHYNGDNQAEIAVYRSSNGNWYIKAGPPYVCWGIQPGDMLVARGDK